MQLLTSLAKTHFRPKIKPIISSTPIGCASYNTILAGLILKLLHTACYFRELTWASWPLAGVWRQPAWGTLSAQMDSPICPCCPTCRMAGFCPTPWPLQGHSDPCFPPSSRRTVSTSLSHRLSSHLLPGNFYIRNSTRKIEEWNKSGKIFWRIFRGKSKHNIHCYIAREIIIVRETKLYRICSVC